MVGEPDHSALPREVRALAKRLGATEETVASVVNLTQRGTMSDAPGSRVLHFTASQTIRTDRPEFIWRAKLGPLGSVVVTDSLKAGEAGIDVRLFRVLRLAAVRSGDAIIKGELMRYLAELAWAPDAIVCNRALSWTVLDNDTYRVSAAIGQVHSQLDLTLGADGRIATVFASDRPRKEGALFIERPWRGRFFDYRLHANRWLPFRAEVAWVLDGQEFIAWRGEITGWTRA